MPPRHLMTVLITMALVLASWQAQANGDSQLLADAAESQCATMRQALGLSGAACQALGFAQETIAGDITHLTFSLQVGSGAHDVIRLHRVVRESNGIPRPTNKTIFMVHGDVWDFTAAFLGGTLSDADGVPDEQSIAVFLAANNVDVWGIDMRWTQVPPDTTDFTFMADWGLLRLASDVGIGLATARNIRALTGAGMGKVPLLGWSGGGFISWVYANVETQLPSGLRHMKGLIPVDIFFKLAPAAENQRQDACTRQDTLQALFDSGMFHNDTGNLVATVGQLALADPNGASVIIPGLTNAQAGLFVGTSTFVLAAPPPVPFYHFTAGAFDAMGLPTGLRFTDEAFFFEFLASGKPFQPQRELLEKEMIVCDEEDSPFDDFLSEVTVPIFYIGAAGGFGAFGEHTTTLTGSADVTTLVVSLEPPAQQPIDFGHSDMFQADNAQQLVWKPLLKWLKGH